MNWEVNLGSLLIVASVIFSAGGFYAVSRWENQRNKEDMKRINAELKEDITDIKADLKKLNEVVVNVALQNQRLDNQGERVNGLEQRFDSRMNALERRWEELRRGEGIITERPRAGA